MRIIERSVERKNKMKKEVKKGKYERQCSRKRGIETACQKDG